MFYVIWNYLACYFSVQYWYHHQLKQLVWYFFRFLNSDYVTSLSCRLTALHHCASAHMTTVVGALPYGAGWIMALLIYWPIHCSETWLLPLQLPLLFALSFLASPDGCLFVYGWLGDSDKLIRKIKRRSRDRPIVSSSEKECWLTRQDCSNLYRPSRPQNDRRTGNRLSSVNEIPGMRRRSNKKHADESTMNTRNFGKDRAKVREMNPCTRNMRGRNWCGTTVERQRREHRQRSW